MRYLTLLFFIWLSFAAKAQQKMAIMLSHRAVATQIQHQLRNKSGDSIFVDIPLPRILELTDSTRINFLDIISAKKIDYSNYTVTFDNVKSIAELSNLAKQNGMSDSFLVVAGHASFSTDSITIVTDTINNVNFNAASYEQTLNIHKTLFSLQISAVHMDVNNQSIDASLQSKTISSNAFIATKDFNYRNTQNISDSCLYYLESLPQDGFALFIDTAFVRSHILKNTEYNGLTIDQPAIKYTDDALILSFQAYGHFGNRNLQNKYLVSLTLDASRLKIKDLDVATVGQISNTEYSVVKYLATVWLNRNKGKTFKYNNALQNVPIKSGGKSYNLKVDLMYAYYQSSNLILLCSVFQ